MVCIFILAAFAVFGVGSAQLLLLYRRIQSEARQVTLVNFKLNKQDYRVLFFGQDGLLAFADSQILTI